MSATIPEVESVRAVGLKRGDVLVFTVPKKLDPERFERLRTSLQDFWGKEHRACILTEGITMQVLSALPDFETCEAGAGI